MKILGLLMFLIAALPMQQEASLPRNKAGKIAFEDYVVVERLGKEALFRNAMSYASGLQKVSDKSEKIRFSASEGNVRKEGSFLVYKKGLFTSQIHGEVAYTLQLTVDEQGYAYSFTDFVFQYYDKNRYGRYVPLSGKKKPLEEEKFAGMQDLWKAHKESTRSHIQNQIQALKAHMPVLPPGARKERELQHEELN